MWFRILGPLELVGNAGPIALNAPRQSIVLSTLLLESNRIVSVERLVDMVWPDEPPATARGQIQICISSLRGILSANEIPATINTRSPGYLIEVAPDGVDLLVFERRIADGRQAFTAGRLDEAAKAFAGALGLWRGGPFAGTSSPTLQSAANTLEERHLAAIEEHADLRMRLHQHQDIVGELTDLVERYPLRERLRARLMLALFRCDRRADALEVYRVGRRILVDELGLEPGDQLRQLEQAILSDDPDLRVGSGVGGNVQGGPPTVPRMLPAALPDITGHQEITETMRRHLSRQDGGSATVVAISGRGGVGKTTVATYLAHTVADEFPDGQLYASLNGAGADQPTTTAEVAGRFLRALGVPANSLPEQLGERLEMFRSRVADQRIIVMLDDCVNEEQVQSLIPATPSCAVLLTSRQRLTGLSGALHVEVGVLGVDDALGLVRRVIGHDRVEAEPAAAVELVALCGALPLALRVAGARLAARPHWTIGHLVRRLSDERQRLSELRHGGLDVRASLGLSYRGLGEDAQRLFRRLSQAYSSDFGAWICGPLMDADEFTAGDLLDELVDARLVDVERGRGTLARFKLHDLIRAYAREQLEAAESDGDRRDTMRRLAGAWLFLAERAHRSEYGGDYTVIHGDAPRWILPEATVETVTADSLTWYDKERAGLLAAVRGSAEAGLSEACWDLAMTSVTLFEHRRYFADWRLSHDLALQAALRDGNSRGQAAMRLSLGSLNTFEQKHDKARPLLLEAARLFKEIGHDHGYALVLRNVAYLDRVTGDLDAASNGFHEALELLRATGDLVGEAHVLSNIAQIRLDRGDTEAAASDLKLALVAAEETGARRVHAQVLCRLGDLHLGAGELAESEWSFQTALDLVLVLRDRVGEAYARHGLSLATLRMGRYAEAEEMLAVALQLAMELDEAFIEARICLTISEMHCELGRRDQAHRAASRAVELFGRLNAGRWRAQALTFVDRADALSA